MNSLFAKRIRLFSRVGVALGVASLLLPLAASAAPPPANRTYFVVAVGLVSSYDIKAQCFSFTATALCSLDGEICGTWQRLDSEQEQSSFAFELFALEEGRRVTMEGVGTVDGRGPKSALAGAGRLTGLGPASNFAFSGRRASVGACLNLLAEFEGDGQTVVSGSGVVTSESRAVEGFSGVVLDGVGKLLIEQTGTESLTISAEDNILPHLRSEVIGDLLLLGPAPETSLSSTKPIIYRLAVASLDELIVSGVSTVRASGIDTPRLTVSLSGVTTVKVAGKTDDQVITISGTSIYKARRLKSKTAVVDISGLGQAVIKVSEQLSGSVSDFGILEYLGDPVVDVEVSGFGELKGFGDD